MKTLAAALFIALISSCLPAAAHAQRDFPTEGLGNPYKDPAQRSADHCARGIRFKSKAEKEQNEAKRTKLYARAKDELNKSVGLHRTFDALLALGQVYLALGQDRSALEACTSALAFKPSAMEADHCVEQAQESLTSTASNG